MVETDTKKNKTKVKKDKSVSIIDNQSIVSQDQIKIQKEQERREQVKR